MPSNIEIVGLNKQNFHEVVTFAQRILSHPFGGRYKRVEAQQFIIENQDNTFVLEVNGVVAGAYAYNDNPNSYGLSFFALGVDYRRRKSGYRLYQDMKTRLINKPVNVVIYDDNDAMMDIVKKRGIFLGRVPSTGGTTISFYSIMFNHFNKKET